MSPFSQQWTVSSNHAIKTNSPSLVLLPVGYLLVGKRKATNTLTLFGEQSISRESKSVIFGNHPSQLSTPTRAVSSAPPPHQGQSAQHSLQGSQFSTPSRAVSSAPPPGQSASWQNSFWPRGMEPTVEGPCWGHRTEREFAQRKTWP